MDLLPVLERLVTIPSWRSSDNPDVEAGVSEYLTELIQRELPWLHIDHQVVEGNRFNIFATDGAPVQFLFVGHLDTKPPGAEWTRRSTGERVGNRYYGRGTVDPKGGVAALLAALAAVGETRGVGLLLYCDEVYDCHGMRTFLAEVRDRVRPVFTIAIQPTKLRVWNGCRGVGEFRPIVRGKPGFAATPTSGGRSALTAFVGGMRALDALLEANANPAFGRMSVNVAALRCGQSRGRHDGREVLGEDRNIIPDYAEGVIEVRTSPGVDLDACITAFEQGVIAAGGRLEVAMKRFDFRGYHVPPEQLRPLTDAIAAVLGRPAEFEALEAHGYSDAQLLHDQLEVPTAMFGPTGGNYHAADEYVELESLGKVQTILERVLQPYRVGVPTSTTTARTRARVV